MSNYTYHPFHSIGAANLLLWDPAALSGSGAWARLGRVADAAVLISGEILEKDLVVKGLSQPLARRPHSRRYSLSLRLLEAANPAVLDLLFADGSVPLSGTASTQAVSESLRLFGLEYCELAHPFGILASPALTLKSYDGATTYSAVTDYEFDRARGLLKRRSGSAIAEGAPVVASYSYARPAGISASLGSAAALERYARLKLLQLAPADNGSLEPLDWRENGVEFEFYRVSLHSPESRWPFTEESFSEGSPQSWDCLYSSEQGGVGTVRSSFGVLAAWT